MRFNPVLAASYTYSLKMDILENRQPEIFLVLPKHFRTAINKTGTRTVAVWIKYLCTMIHGETSRKFDELEIQNNGMMNAQLKHIY